MIFKHRWLRWFINVLLGGGYITIILSMIKWASNGEMGVIAFFIPLVFLIIFILYWTLRDRKKQQTPQSEPWVKQIDG